MHRGDLGCDAVHGEDDVDQGQREDHQEERGDLHWEPEFPGFYVDVATRMVVFSGISPCCFGGFSQGLDSSRDGGNFRSNGDVDGCF